MIFPSVIVDDSAGIKISLTALQVSIRWFRRAVSAFCGNAVKYLPLNAGLLHCALNCMALCMAMLAVDQRNAKVVRAI